jgi:predicted transcriptional regulator
MTAHGPPDRREELEEDERHLAAIDEGIAAADAGELIDFADVEADVRKKLASLSIRR